MESDSGMQKSRPLLDHDDLETLERRTGIKVAGRRIGHSQLIDAEGALDSALTRLLVAYPENKARLEATEVLTRALDATNTLSRFHLRESLPSTPGSARAVSFVEDELDRVQPHASVAYYQVLQELPSILTSALKANRALRGHPKTEWLVQGCAGMLGVISSLTGPNSLPGKETTAVAALKNINFKFFVVLVEILKAKCSDVDWLVEWPELHQRQMIENVNILASYLVSPVNLTKILRRSLAHTEAILGELEDEDWIGHDVSSGEVRRVVRGRSIFIKGNEE